MIMGKAHKKIIDVLNEQPRTMNELITQTGYTNDGLRGRISELRKMGYVIELSVPMIKEYSIKANPRDRILSWVKDTNNYGKTVNINVMSRDLELPKKLIVEAVSELFKTHKVVQYTNDTFIIRSS